MNSSPIWDHIANELLKLQQDIARAKQHTPGTTFNK